MAAIHFSKDGFEKAVSSNGLVMVDFWATWCGPCQMLGPVIEDLADKYEGKAIVGKIDVDDEQEIAVRFGVMTIPTVIFFKNGVEFERKVGLMGPEVYSAILDANL